MSETPGLHLVLGPEDLLVERAVSGILRSAQAEAGTGDIPVNRLRAGEVSANELAELLSPSLFADERVVILEAADEAGKDSVDVVLPAAADLPPGIVLVVIHSGGGKSPAARGLPAQLRALGATEHQAAKIGNARERAAFVRGEFRGLKVKVDEGTVTALIEAVGSDLRELASVCSQLVADTGGVVNVAAVRRYYSGKAEVTGFEIADKAVTGDLAGSAEAVRWALAGRVPHVLLADALAEAIHSIARIAPLRGNPNQLAGELKMPPWKVEKAQKQSRRWSPDKLTTAICLVAALNADVKGAAADADYAVESTVRKIAELADAP
ncbi:MAG: DNA polymerase III subunit delta [Mycobacterium sp.]